MHIFLYIFFCHFKKLNVSLQLTDVNWELHLQLSQSTVSKMKKAVGLIELTLDSSSGLEKVQMEFNHDELYSFYNQVIVFSIIYLFSIFIYNNILFYPTNILSFVIKVLIYE